MSKIRIKLIPTMLDKKNPIEKRIKIVVIANGIERSPDGIGLNFLDVCLLSESISNRSLVNK